MKPCSFVLVVFLMAIVGWQPAQATDAPTVGIGDALFGCTSVATYGNLVDLARHRQPRAFAAGLLTGVQNGTCVAFKSRQRVIRVDATSQPQLVQIRLVDGGPGYWTSLSQLNGEKPALPEYFGNVVTKLYTGKGAKQPLLVMLRGSGGGNDWATSRYEEERSAFLQQGYAVLALGYFAGRHEGRSMHGLPRFLDRISLDAVHKAILKAAESPKVDGQCIAVVGSSRGSELALLLASHFNDIKAVVAMKPSDVAYFSVVPPFKTTSWYFNDKPVPFVPFDGRALLASLKQKPGASLKPIYDLVRQDDERLNDAKIHVEDINGPILLISGASDDTWPSTTMANFIVERLKSHDFPHYFEHMTVKGGHEAAERHFDAVRHFLGRYFKTGTASGCATK